MVVILEVVQVVVVQVLKVAIQIRQVLVQVLTVAFKNKLTIGKDSSGTHLIVRFPADLELETVMESASDAEVALVSTAAYYVEDAPPNEYLLSFGGSEEDKIRAGIERFAQLLAERCNFPS